MDSTMSDGGGSMQSCSKRQRIPVQNVAAIPILKSLEKVLVEAGLETLISVPIKRYELAFGIILNVANRISRVEKMIFGWKLVYSGDTRPLLQLNQASCGVTVPIHEATFKYSLSKEAEE
ncbi:tRNase Z TRZ3, mitochondrial-like [Olea europaea var. sylvestris]|uniref:ribonuclease Z n=1 Tax=Olea europaea subsp. europaea TaxID=158383 RepID=A0A8S0RQ18_OLEEU|nr:tRNase Z TRZ3, mitochondrial-like [Olea europaea var. sylvestris]XP_022879996.1 tRNase Z TRZ3, mitochondrial-like [Olea europaea var. sylvestris]XP_022879997.1 tRNase Z TRZ3, mitochondrial-like [Olea europaea var. sylvestris]XP_022879998.1 tRNase Z TRZ3, mitochondrial-like [Olea europaea var. sylvestris]XP_022880000.1 tRNase Z TRZ3, mitochondrial-like [Olea europaea var. sylvestris]XP_022880001.1 tRNase Z TRZ3, mitochondrial-like [Olea europaea var. sylvestris]XP_022880002.1 tRNase Z TRZ3,